MTANRFLTKSRFKLATECPTKLFYTGKKEYANQKLDDSFLAALADGGFQVGELAKCYFPGGHDIETLDHQLALDQTNELLELDEVIIYEAAIATDKLFIRADVLVKKRNILYLYEVKAKSYDPDKNGDFYTKGGKIKSSWEPYLFDVAFQKYVINKALPQYTVLSHLIMADKSALCPTDGLNQKFKFKKNSSGRKSVEKPKELTDKDLSTPILCKVNVDAECNVIYEQTHEYGNNFFSFKQLVDYFAENYSTDTKIDSPVSTNCAGCEFYTTHRDEEDGLKSGKKECWKKYLGWNDSDFSQATVLDVWNFRKKSSLIQKGCIRMSDIHEDDINPQPDGRAGVSPSERQWLQVSKYQNQDDSIWLDSASLKSEMDSWVYPLHFIDFETSMVAIPFNKGRRPYEGIAFQFSHHVVQQDGSIEHFGEYLNTQPGKFPNYDFVRELKKQLSHDDGTIFRYSNHENTYLNMIYRQIKDDNLTDSEELCEFIKSITRSGNDYIESWEGPRNMVDLWELVKRYYYNPVTRGSNSIKQVLPAILNSSSFLQEKYSKPIYGASNGIKSLNFKDWQWIQIKDGYITDPYKLLPKMFTDISDKNMEILSEGNELNDGGAALTAYARMQFEEMIEYERQEICKALLKYCELDTMAMVMIYEGWKDMLG